MSWANVTPWWVYEAEYEEFLMRCSCATYEEIRSGFCKKTPQNIINMIKKEQQ